jgi:hypothetical protein
MNALALEVLRYLNCNFMNALLNRRAPNQYFQFFLAA